jgi:hypothetical protein
VRVDLCRLAGGPARGAGHRPIRRHDLGDARRIGSIARWQSQFRRKVWLAANNHALRASVVAYNQLRIFLLKSYTAWGSIMKKLLVVLLSSLPFVAFAADYQSTLLVQTGKLRESDLIVRTISDLESNRICLAFYIRTGGTSPMISCYDVKSGFRSKIHQVGHYKEGKMVIRKIKDSVNDVSCLVTYVMVAGTSPAIQCYTSKAAPKFRTTEAIISNGHLREGDLDVHKIVDGDSGQACVIAYVDTEGTSPSVACYPSVAAGKGGLVQSHQLREGDLIVRKVTDQANRKECLITYVSTPGTSPHIYCAELYATASATGVPRQ